MAQALVAESGPNTVGQTDARTRASQAAFLRVYARTANISASARAAKVGRTTVYEWQEHSNEFVLAMQQAREEACDRLEAEALRRAVEGVKRRRPVFSNGKVVDWEVVTEYSDRLLEALLKAARPEKYRERVDVSGAVQVVKTLGGGVDPGAVV